MKDSNLRLWGIHKPISRPDIDNLEKFILDCGNGILWPDDRFITHLSSKKIYSKNPCTIISITPIPELKMTKEQENVFKTFEPDSLCDFFDDLRKIYLAFGAITDTHRIDIAHEEMAPTADILIEFSNKWADKLRKIKGK